MILKIKKIEKICKANATIVRVDVTDGKQELRNVFLGTDAAQFELSRDFWKFSPEVFFDVFGIGEKAQEKWYTDLQEAFGEDGFLYDDIFSGEKQAFPQELLITFGETTWRAFISEENRVYFVPEGWLSGYDREDEHVYYFIRNAGANDYLAVKIGMYLDGIIRIPKAQFAKPLEDMRNALQELAAFDRKER